MMSAIQLTDAINEWLDWREHAQNIKAGTLRLDVINLRKLERVTGNIKVHNITGEHITRVMARQSGNSAGSINNTLKSLRSFFGWARQYGYMPRHADPMAGVRTQQRDVKEWRHLPREKFPALLDAARNPRDRIFLATAMYMMLRQSEIRSLRIGDINLEAGEIVVTVHKKGRGKAIHQDRMPIVAELDTELRNWLTIYTEMAGPLQSDWYLCPGTKMTANLQTHATTGHFIAPGPDEWQATRTIHPAVQTFKPHHIAQYALEAVGFSTRDSRGKSMHEGMHTIRRSSARALFDALVGDGYDGALKVVQTWLHHEKSEMTEHYLGLTLDKEKRDQKFKGQSMFPVPSNVVSMQLLREGT